MLVNKGNKQMEIILLLHHALEGSLLEMCTGRPCLKIGMGSLLTVLSFKQSFQVKRVTK